MIETENDRSVEIMVGGDFRTDPIVRHSQCKGYFPGGVHVSRSVDHNGLRNILSRVISRMDDIEPQRSQIHRHVAGKALDAAAVQNLYLDDIAEKTVGVLMTPRIRPARADAVYECIAERHGGSDGNGKTDIQKPVTES